MPTPYPITLPADCYRCWCGAPFGAGWSRYAPSRGSLGPAFLTSRVRVVACTACRHHFVWESGGFRDLTRAEAAEYAQRPDFRERMDRSLRLSHAAGLWG